MVLADGFGNASAAAPVTVHAATGCSFARAAPLPSPLAPLLRLVLGLVGRRLLQ